MNKRCACNCSSKYQQNFVSPTLRFCKVKWLSFGEMTSKRCPMPWGHAQPFLRELLCLAGNAGALWLRRLSHVSSKAVHQKYTTILLASVLFCQPAWPVGLLLFHNLTLTEGSAVYLHTQAAIKAVSLLSFRAAEH